MVYHAVVAVVVFDLYPISPILHLQKSEGEGTTVQFWWEVEASIKCSKCSCQVYSNRCESRISMLVFATRC